MFVHFSIKRSVYWSVSNESRVTYEMSYTLVMKLNSMHHLNRSTVKLVCHRALPESCSSKSLCSTRVWNCFGQWSSQSFNSTKQFKLNWNTISHGKSFNRVSLWNLAITKISNLTLSEYCSCLHHSCPASEFAHNMCIKNSDRVNAAQRVIRNTSVMWLIESSFLAHTFKWIQQHFETSADKNSRQCDRCNRLFDLQITAL